MLRSLLLFACLTTTALLTAQQSGMYDAYYLEFDAMVGIENTDLYNGTEYIEGYKTTRDKNRFFIRSEFFPGSVVYDEQAYHGIQLKYDIFDDQLIVSLQNQEQESVIQLNKADVSQFTLDGHLFKHLKFQQKNIEQPPGYYEVVAIYPKLILYEKHRKKRWKKEDKRVVYFEFTDAKSDFLCAYKDSFLSLRSRNDVYELFPQYKKQLKSYYAANQNLHRAANRDLFKALLNQVARLEAESTRTKG